MILGSKHHRYYIPHGEYSIYASMHYVTLCGAHAASHNSCSNHACVNDHISTYIHGYSTKMAKSMVRHGFLWLNHPPKIPTYEASTYQKGSSLIDACQFRANFFLQSFTVRALLLSEMRRKMCFTVLKTPPAAFFSRDSFSQLLSP